MNTLVVHTAESGEQDVLDVFAILQHERILFITDYIDSDQANDIIASLLLKDSENNDPISIFINSEGGDIRDVFSIVNTMQILRSPIKTIVLGSVMNESVLILLSGTKGMRYATKNSVICPSQLFKNESSFSDLDGAKSTLDRLTKDNKEFMKLVAKKTSKKYAQVIKDFDRMKFFDVKSAIKYGMIDKVFE